MNDLSQKQQEGKVKREAEEADWLNRLTDAILSGRH
jgi:hypothetical protein